MDVSKLSIIKCIKKVPDNIEAIKFNGKNFNEIYAYLRTKAVYSSFIKTKTLRQVHFFDNFTLKKVNIDNYIVFDPKIRSFEVLPEFEFKEKYVVKGTIYTEDEA